MNNISGLVRPADVRPPVGTPAPNPTSKSKVGSARDPFPHLTPP